MAVAGSLLMAAIASPVGAQLPGGMAGTWQRFQMAVQRQDPDAMARISHFPLQSNDFGGAIDGVATLRQRFGWIFSADRRHCLLHQSPTPLRIEGRVLYEAFCDTDHQPIRFLFERIAGEYRWTTIDNVNE